MSNNLTEQWIRMKTFVVSDLQRTMRVPIQTLVTPWLSALLYILIFGQIVGSRIQEIGGIPYINFVLPGILMMNILSSAFAQTSSSLYFKRFLKHIEELLVAPFSYLELVIGFTIGGIIRGILVGAGIYVIAIFFGIAGIEHVGLFFFYVIAVSAIFSLLGLFVGLWAQGFEQLSVLNVFVITPLAFLGGMFNTLDMLPPWAQTLTLWNPFFYFNDGIRYAMTGHSEASLTLGFAIIVGLILVFGAIIHYLFHIGWRLRA
jgi:ABC-2 type transport system permease protein